MKLVYKYIFWNLVKTFCITIFVFLFIGFLTRVFHYSDIITENGGSFADFATILLLIQPKMIVVLSPFTALIACFIVYNNLIHSNENTAIYTAGESDIRLLIPFFYFSGILVIINLFFASFLVPYSYREMEDIHQKLAVNFSNSLLKPKTFINNQGVTIFINEVKNGKIAEGILIIDERVKANKSIIIADSGTIGFNGEAIIFKAEDTYLSKKTVYSPFPVISKFKEYLVSFYIKSFNTTENQKTISYQVNKVLFKEFKKGNLKTIKEIKVRFGSPLFTILIPFSMITCLLVFFNSTRSRILLKNIIYTAIILGYIVFSALFGELSFNGSTFQLFLYFINIFLIFTFLIFTIRTRIF